MRKSSTCTHWPNACTRETVLGAADHHSCEPTPGSDGECHGAGWVVYEQVRQKMQEHENVDRLHRIVDGRVLAVDTCIHAVIDLNLWDVGHDKDNSCTRGYINR